MKIRDLLRVKGSLVVTITPDVPIQEAMRVLVNNGIGALVVVDGRLRGIITERDLLRWGAEDIQRLATSRVRDLMTVELITASPDAEIEEVMDIMTEKRIRHLPIVDQGALCGIISIGDVVNALRQSVEVENRYLHAYIEGTPL
ncbi:MAG TPA: CBS domain-containing protein [Longimicrobiaceae bacterium]